MGRLCYFFKPEYSGLCQTDGNINSKCNALLLVRYLRFSHVPALILSAVTANKLVTIISVLAVAGRPKIKLLTFETPVFCSTSQHVAETGLYFYFKFGAKVFCC